MGMVGCPETNDGQLLLLLQLFPPLWAAACLPRCVVDVLRDQRGSAPVHSASDNEYRAWGLGYIPSPWALFRTAALGRKVGWWWLHLTVRSHSARHWLQQQQSRSSAPPCTTSSVFSFVPTLMPPSSSTAVICLVVFPLKVPMRLVGNS